MLAAITFVFAAAMVRFTFAAALIAAAVVGLVSSPQTRRLMLAGGLAVLLVIAAGLISRPSTAMLYANFAARSLGIGSSAPLQTDDVASAASPECQPIEEANSIEIRKALYREWFRLMPQSGLTGIGLDNFNQRSCMPKYEVHNDALQIALEFGWPAGGLFVLLISSAIFRLLRARSDERARFGLFALSFLVLMSFAHGRISRDFLLFFFIGYAVQFGTTRPAARSDGSR